MEQLIEQQKRIEELEEALRAYATRDNWTVADHWAYDSCWDGAEDGWVLAQRVLGRGEQKQEGEEA